MREVFTLLNMKGAIAAGHPLTAEVGARVLRAGGSAVDACVAAAFVSWVCESPLTGPGGGGFMLVHEAESGRTVVLDFFVAVPQAAPAPTVMGPAPTAIRSSSSGRGRLRSRFRGRRSGSRRRMSGGAGCRGRSSWRRLPRWRGAGSC